MDGSVPERPLLVAVAGITGALGSCLARGLSADEGVRLVWGVARSGSADRRGGAVLPHGPVPVVPDVLSGLDDPSLPRPDILLDVTSPAVARRHAAAALDRGVRVVIGATDGDEDELPALAETAVRRGVAVAVVPNFSLAVAWMERICRAGSGGWTCAHLLDGASPGVPAPLRTTAFLSAALSEARIPHTVRSERRESLVSRVTLDFESATERFRLESSVDDAEAYVRGARAAVRAIPHRVGLLNGLAWVLDA